MKIEWILCPFCGGKTRLKIRYDTSAKLTRLQKFLEKENPVIRRLYWGWGIPDDKYVTAADMMEQAISHTHLKPYTEPDGFGGDCCCDLCREYPCDDEYDY